MSNATHGVERPRRYFVDTSNGFVHVQDCGRGDRVVVFVTITSFGGVLLDRVLPLMAARGYRALSLDLMGYGLSDKRTRSWSIDEFADNLLEALDLAGVTAAGLVFGHFSGLVGIEIAARAPHGLEGVVLDGTPLIGEEAQAGHSPGAGPAPIAWKEDGSHAVAFWNRAYRLIRMLNPEQPLEEQPDNLTRQAYLAYLSVASFEPGTMDAYAGFDVRSRLGDVALPTQVMCSDTDWNLPHHAYFVDRIAGAREVRFAGVHPMHELNRPDRAGEYVEAIDSFFGPLIQPR